MDRRSFLRGSALATTAVATTAAGVGTALGPGFWQAALAAPATLGEGPYGPLQPPDANGVMLPEGFTSRVVAVSGEMVEGTDYTWHPMPDGAATFPAEDGGWFHAVNSEVRSGPNGGVGVLRFDADGQIVDAYRILDGTSTNCAGGATPWGTWLSCEEVPQGYVWECDPSKPGEGVQRPMLGQFSHEAVAVDPDRRRLYLTEDLQTGHYYRFTPDAYPDLSAGTLEAASLGEDGTVTWNLVPIAEAQAQPQTFGIATDFDGGEGIWYDPAGTGFMYFTTKGDNRVWVHDLEADRITVLYDAADFGEDAPLTGVDNIVVASSGDLYVGEDGGNLEVVLITAESRVTTPFLRLPGPEHELSEITGPCFSPDGTRLYFSSQRGTRDGSGQAEGDGITFEVTGPFRLNRVGTPAVTMETAEAVRRTVVRIAGGDRYETAAEVARTAASFLGDVTTVHLARGTAFPDGLAGAPLVIAEGSVLLLTPSDELADDTADVLGELGPDRVVALGGTTAISDSVLAAAGRAAGGASTSRVEGGDRYATAAAVARELPASGRAFLAVGTDFPDALAGGPATDGAPVLLVESDRLPDVTAEVLRDVRPGEVVALGGPEAISQGVLDAAADAAGGTSSRLSGGDRYATAVTIAETYDDPSTAYLALGTDFPDALAAAPAAAAMGAPILLVEGDELPAATRRWLEASSVTRAIVLGGEQAVSRDVRDAVQAAID